ncbi:MAG: hypothetical protein R3230_01275 [Nitrosopumilaceae archaeon]|nr:hypothetical protein [Nitrosopumilaceae archaeon]
MAQIIERAENKVRVALTRKRHEKQKFGDVIKHKIKMCEKHNIDFFKPNFAPLLKRKKQQLNKLWEGIPCPDILILRKDENGELFLDFDYGDIWKGWKYPLITRDIYNRWIQERVHEMEN